MLQSFLIKVLYILNIIPTFTSSNKNYMKNLNNYFANLQDNENAMILAMALEHDAIVSHQNDLRYEYGMQDRQERAEAEREYNDNFNF